MAYNHTLSIEKVSKRYRAGKEVLRNISMQISPGEAVLLVGPNGSGKTTFLKLLSVNAFPTEGRILWGEVDIHREPSSYLRYVGLVHDEESLPVHLSALELLEWILRSRGLWSTDSPQKMNRLLDRLQLDDSRQEEIGSYSTGMRKKAQIAAAVISGPSLLILDEPLRGLDTSATGRTMELFREAVSDGTTLLMATHGEAVGDELFGRTLHFPLEG